MSEKSVIPYTLLHLRFILRVSPEVLIAKCQEAANVIAFAEGLIWKIWVFKKDGLELGGIYLFANRETAEAYLNHPVIQAVRINPSVVSTEYQLWDVESSLSAITRAPLGELVAQYSESAAVMAGGR
jgi:hypothetical protein